MPMRFGWLPAGPKERVHLNVRSESAAHTAGSQHALVERRCLVPATAFHEWSGPKGKREHHLFAPDRVGPSGAGLLTLAGLYARQGEGPSRFVILTTAASHDVRPAHHRMPLIVPADLRARWIDCAPDDSAQTAPDEVLARMRRQEAPRMLDRLRPPT